MLTDQDGTAMAVAAALLTALARAEPASSRVVITGMPAVPFLPPLLITAGICEIDSWNAWDAVGFGLNRLVYGADAVIDPLGCVSHRLFDRVQPVIISPGPRMDGCRYRAR